MNWHGVPDHLVHAALSERRATVAQQAERARFALADAERTLAALDIVMARATAPTRAAGAQDGQEDQI
ncbi:MAG TPA: hypothetical protein VKS60_20405 [Stellaceae bacterium]|nr:hypothetical protein [Stellaceae bacterium]